jgi:hypothetical protein
MGDRDLWDYFDDLAHELEPDHWSSYDTNG